MGPEGPDVDADHLRQTQTLHAQVSKKYWGISRHTSEVYYTSGVLTIFPSDHIRAPYTLINCWVSIWSALFSTTLEIHTTALFREDRALICPEHPYGTWSCLRGSSGLLSPPRTRRKCPVCGRQTAIWSGPLAPQTTPRRLQSRSLSGGTKWTYKWGMHQLFQITLISCFLALICAGVKVIKVSADFLKPLLLLKLLSKNPATIIGATHVWFNRFNVLMMKPSQELKAFFPKI